LLLSLTSSEHCCHLYLGILYPKENIWLKKEKGEYDDEAFETFMGSQEMCLLLCVYIYKLCGCVSVIHGGGWEGWVVEPVSFRTHKS
jgi:hypothetical protein